MKMGLATPARLTVRAGSLPQEKRIVPVLPEGTAVAPGVSVAQLVVRDAKGEALNVGPTLDATSRRSKRDKITLYR